MRIITLLVSLLLTGCNQEVCKLNEAQWLSARAN
jgi:hypothetical protein